MCLLYKYVRIYNHIDACICYCLKQSCASVFVRAYANDCMRAKMHMYD